MAGRDDPLTAEEGEGAPGMPPLLSRLAIVNRGEAAMRCIHAARERNAEGHPPLTIIALYTDVERRAMFVREADEAVLLGPARTGYLDLGLLERALVEARADAVWVGWGFVSEQPGFVELCERLGITFVGPDAATMRRIGDKIASKQLAEQAGVPVAPWSGGPVPTVAEAEEHAATIGYPLMVKATAGGGGRGIRRVDRPEDLAEAFASARAEATTAFGDPTVFLERLIAPARHIEVQVIADGAGAAWAVGVRDCSLQRRHQKVIEESSSPVLDHDQERSVGEAATRLVLSAGYRGAGTVEFLYDPATSSFSFMEVNARLQVEHPVTEMTTGLDLVKLQLHIAGGGRLEGEAPSVHGHAVEARLNAEDPARGFLPAPGVIELLRLPTGPGIRVDTGVAEGDVIPAAFDSMIAKVLAWGADRKEALARLQRALAGTAVVVRQGTTNQGFLLDLLGRPELATSAFDTGWLDREQAAHGFLPTSFADLALVQAAIHLSDAADDVEASRFFGWARRGRPQMTVDIGGLVELRHDGHTYRLRTWRLGPAVWRVEMDGQVVEVAVEDLGRHEARLSVRGRSHRVVTSEQGADLLVAVNGVTHRLSRDDGGLVRTPAPAVVVAIPVAEGGEVAAGDTVAVLEAMKMETALTAPFAGRVRAVLCATNVQVDAGTALVQLEPAVGDEVAVASVSGERVGFEHLVETTRDDDARHRCRANHQLLEWLLLGYDVPDGEVRRIGEEEPALCASLGVADPGLLEGEQRLLALYGDLRSLTRPREADESGVVGHDPNEYLNAFLRSLDASGEGLPAKYVALLERVVAAYGLDGLDRGPALEEVMYRVYRSIQRREPQRSAVLSVLARRLDQADQLVGAVGPEFGEVLDRLIAATRLRDPVVADQARAVRHCYVTQPLLDSAREATYAEMDAHLAALAARPGPAGRAGHIDCLVQCPRPLAPLLMRRVPTAPLDEQVDLLEVLTRRYYRNRALGAFTVDDVLGTRLVSAPFSYDGRPVWVVTAFVSIDQLVSVVAAVAEWSARRAEGELVLVDLHAIGPATAGGERPPAGAAHLAGVLSGALAATVMPDTVHRLVLATARPGVERAMSAVDLVTMQRTNGAASAEPAFVEDESLRGLHPMMAERLHVWRLANFDIERLPSPEDVHLFHGVARSSQADERLFAIAEVRDLTPARDEHGTVVALPELEYVLGQVVEAMRRFQALRPPQKRLQWNRVQLYVWPPILLDPGEIQAVAARLAPVTAGQGIEMTLVRGRMPDGPGGALRDRVLRISSPAAGGAVVEVDDPPNEPLRSLDDYTRKVVQSRRRGSVYPYELLHLLAPSADSPGIPRGDFTEYDLDKAGQALAPVDRAPGANTSGVVVGVVRSFTARHPEGMTRVVLLGDPTMALGSIAEPESRRVIAALDLADRLGAPAEWFTLSAGAKIAMDSGTENMDWVAAVLRRIIEFTQAGGELNVVVAGINVGAQPYWNAEATMLMHTRGILVMTPEGAMVLTGKEALDYSGGVSAEDNLGIGGYERVMGPNGQAQYWAPDLARAVAVLLAHYDHSYVAPGERFPRRAPTTDPLDRDVRAFPHPGGDSPFTTVGAIFSVAENPERKKPFDIRTVMQAVSDQDHRTMERWSDLRGADTAVVWDAHIGGWPVTLVGIESRPLVRHGPVPADGPDSWTSGTLFPMSSKKIARAVNATSGTRPLVVLANLSGFDGSPESLRSLQLEFGAEIGRAVVNFDGPIVFCVVSRYHGGAFVVFSRQLNDGLEALALEGSRASVIGGAPAAAVVFAHEVRVRAVNDERVAELADRVAQAEGTDKERLRARLAETTEAVLAEKRGELAAEFDAVHSVERARRVGSIDAIIPAATLRPAIVDALDRGVQKTLDRLDRDR